MKTTCVFCLLILGWHVSFAAFLLRSRRRSSLFSSTSPQPPRSPCRPRQTPQTARRGRTAPPPPHPLPRNMMARPAFPPATPADDKPVALLATPPKAEALISWLFGHISFLTGASFITTEDIARKLKRDPRTVVLDVAETVPPTVDGGDIVIAERVLSGKVSGVVLFRDAAATHPDVNLLTRATGIADVPFATNVATADLALRGITKTRTAYLIFNPVAGQGDSMAQLAIIREMLEPRLALTVVMTKRDVDPADQAREIVGLIKARPASEASNPAVIIASGGDGTVSAIAGATIGSGVPFAVIPRGTANAFSVALGIPTEVRAACRNILRGNVRVLDGAKCNDMPMTLLAGMGFEAGMVDKADRELKDKIGPLAYVLGGAEQFFTQELFKCNIDIDGRKTSDLMVGAITVANVAPPTSVLAQGFGECIPDDGMLDVTIATSKDLMEGLEALASLATAAVVKEPTKAESLLNVRAKKVVVECEPKQKLVIDGEMVEMDPVTFEVLPGALRVVAPPAVA